MKKKHALAVFAMLLLFLFCAGCEAQPTSIPSESLSASANGKPFDEERFSHEETLPFTKIGTLKLVTTCMGIFNNQVSGTKEGCYLLLQNAQGEYNVLYIDYLSKNMVYLSSDPQSTHQDSADISYLGECPGGASLFCTDTHLYVVILGGTSSTKKEPAPAQIIQMDLDGKNKSVLYTFDNDHMLENTSFASDGESLFFFTYNVRTDKIEFVQLSTKDDAALQVLFTLDGDEICQLIGTFSDGFIIQQISVRENVNRQLNLYKPDESKLQILTETPYEERAFVSHNGNVYSYSTVDGSVRRISLTDSGEELLNPSAFAAGEANHYMQVGDAYDGHFFVLDQNTNDLYAVNCENGAIQKIALQEKGINASIMAESDSSFLVLTGYDDKAFNGTAPDGSPEQQILKIPVYALISKSDYWNSVPNYQPISFIA